MVVSTSPPPVVHVIHHQIERQARGQWKLEILWRFENPSAVPVHILIVQPVSTVIRDPLVLDHSARERSAEERPNVAAAFEILELLPFAVVERRLTYHLAFPESAEPRSIVGRFGFGHSRPDPSWQERKNLRKLAEWQAIVDTDPLPVSWERGPAP